MAKKMANGEIKKKLSDMYRNKKVLIVLGIIILVASPIVVFPLGSLVSSWLPQPDEHCTDIGPCLSRTLFEIIGLGIGCVLVLLMIDFITIAILSIRIEKLELKLPSSSRKGKGKNRKSKKEYADPYL